MCPKNLASRVDALIENNRDALALIARLSKLSSSPSLPSTPTPLSSVDAAGGVSEPALPSTEETRENLAIQIQQLLRSQEEELELLSLQFEDIVNGPGRDQPVADHSSTPAFSRVFGLGNGGLATGAPGGYKWMESKSEKVRLSLKLAHLSDDTKL